LIFVTVGHEIGFDRLISALDNWAVHNTEINLFAQVAKLEETSYRPKNIDYKEFLSPAEFSDYFEKSDLVVAHAGMGTIITAQTMSKPVVILPRRGHLKETRNDHQVATANRFRNRDGIYVADDETLLGATIISALRECEYQSLSRSSEYAEPSLIAAIRDFIHEK